MSAWTLAKMALGLVGVGLLVFADNTGRHWLGYVGLAPIAAAFLLRFVQKRFDPQRKDSATSE